MLPMMFECMFDTISQHLPTDKRQAAYCPANLARWRRDCRHGCGEGPQHNRGRNFNEIEKRRYSHSMVPGGLLVTSSTTRLTSATSLVIRVEIRSSTS